MSRSEWESGTLKLPSAAWAPFKKTIQEGISKLMERDYVLAVQLYAALVEQKKGKRGFDLRKALREEFSKMVPRTSYSRWGGGNSEQKYPFHAVNLYQLDKSILGTEETPKLLKPLKKDYPKVTTATLQFRDVDCSVSLNNETREVHWSTDDNNHSVDHAHESALGKLFFGALSKVKWTRNTGGTLTGNDENNRDNTDEGGGGNYVTQRFGPLGEFKIPSYLRPPRKRAAK